MKKLLVLGGAEAQVQLIHAAKAEGYYVVLCDWTDTNPGIAFADVHYHDSTLDRDAVCQVAKREKVDGVISNSEPAMANVAYVAESLGLVGNPVSSVEILTSKSAFRDLQDKVGLFAPLHYTSNDRNSLLSFAEELKRPFVVKPVRSSGSRGTTRIDVFDSNRVGLAIDACVGFSADGMCAIEEYVEMPSLKVIDGDVFVHNGEILWDGLFCSTRSQAAPMIPMTQMYPVGLPAGQLVTLKRQIANLLFAAGVRHGEYNIEAYYTNNGELFIIEINPRQGGNHIPQIIFEHSGVDMSKLLVTTAVGDDSYFNSAKDLRRQSRYITYYPIFSRKNGVYKGVHVLPPIEQYVVRVDNKLSVGESMEACVNATSVVAFVLLEFPDRETQEFWNDRLEAHVLLN